jgi:hypothetical protein
VAPGSIRNRYPDPGKKAIRPPAVGRLKILRMQMYAVIGFPQLQFQQFRQALPVCGGQADYQYCAFPGGIPQVITQNFISRCHGNLPKSL